MQNNPNFTVKVRGMIIRFFLLWAFAFLGLSIIGVKDFFALSVLTGIFGIIPVYGIIMAAFPAVMFAYTQNPNLVFFIFAFYALMQYFYNRLISPLCDGSKKLCDENNGDDPGKSKSDGW